MLFAVMLSKADTIMKMILQTDLCRTILCGGSLRLGPPMSPGPISLQMKVRMEIGTGYGASVCKWLDRSACGPVC